MAAIIDAGQRIDRSATLHGENWRDLNVPKNPRQPALPLSLSCSNLFIANGQFPKRIEHQAMALILARKNPFGGNIERILRLLVKIRSVVKGFRKCVTRGELQFV